MIYSPCNIDAWRLHPLVNVAYTFVRRIKGIPFKLFDQLSVDACENVVLRDKENVTQNLRIIPPSYEGWVDNIVKIKV